MEAFNIKNSQKNDKEASYDPFAYEIMSIFQNLGWSHLTTSNWTTPSIESFRIAYYWIMCILFCG